MGLDNGFIVEGVSRANLPQEIKYPFDEFIDAKGTVEIAYFRKYWGFRNTYLTLLGQRTSEKYRYYLDQEDLKLAIDLLKTYLEDEDGLFDANNGYWEADVTKKHIKQMRKNLKKFYKWWKEHPNIKVYFYDSY